LIVNPQGQQATQKGTVERVSMAPHPSPLATRLPCFRASPLRAFRGGLPASICLYPPPSVSHSSGCQTGSTPLALVHCICLFRRENPQGTHRNHSPFSYMHARTAHIPHAQRPTRRRWAPPPRSLPADDCSDGQRRSEAAQEISCKPAPMLMRCLQWTLFDGLGYRH